MNIFGLFKKKKEEIKEVPIVRKVPVCAECGGQLGLGVPVTSNEKGMIHLHCR